MNDIIEVGKIINLRGLKGEIKIDPYTESPDRFKEFEYLIIKDEPFNIEDIKIHKGKVFVYLEGIDTVEKAEKLKNTSVYIPREFSEDLEEDEFLLIDLIGLDVYDKNSQEKVGRLKDILQNSGPVDTFVIQLEEKIIYVPALKEYFEISLGDDRQILSQIPEEFYNL